MTTLKGHQGEVVCLTFDPHANLLATGSMDNTAKLWDVETGKEYVTLTGHDAEVVSLNFSVSLVVVVEMDVDVEIKSRMTKEAYRYNCSCPVVNKRLGRCRFVQCFCLGNTLDG